MTTLVADPVAEQRLELARGRHTPTRGMRAAAKRGLKEAKGKEVDPLALNVGRKIGSGAQLSTDHVTAMAEYHAGHNCDGSTEDALWGGPAGAAWSGARMAAMDAAHLSGDETPDLIALGAEGQDVSLEIYVPRGIGEPVQLDESDDGLIWAPILRSGALATRPGPGGERVREPLVFVAGHSDDQRRAVGLQDIVDAYQENAVQHVTIPRTHENDVLDNTGYVEGLKIVESKRKPGEKVLMAAHRFTEPEVKERVQRGSVANRSCGLLYDYVNTETGKSYPVALEHVALTNKPWVTGMTAYGDLAEEDLSERRVVPMLLSEGPAPRDDRLDLASVVDKPWDGSASRFTDQQYARSCVLDKGKGVGSAKERYSLPVREPEGALNRNAVHSAAGMIAKVKGASSEQKRAAARRLISLYRNQLKEDPPPGLLKLAAASTNMSERDRRRELLLADVQWGDEPSLNAIRSQVLEDLQEMRNRGEPGGPPYYYVLDVTSQKALISIEYGDSDPDDAWVVPLTTDDSGEVHLSDFTQWVPVTQEWVTDEDAQSDRDELAGILGGQDLPVPDEDDLSERERSSDRLRLSQERPTTQQGGAMSRPTTQELLERLELSDEARAVFQRLTEENTRQRDQLSQVQKDAREQRVKTRVAELQDQKFPPGFCKRYEALALGDDGQVAAVLNLSGDATALPVEYTATKIADELIAALPRDESGKLALAATGNLIESPISGRPEQTPEEQAQREGGDEAPKTADELLAVWEKEAPEAVQALKLSIAGKEA